MRDDSEKPRDILEAIERIERYAVFGRDRYNQSGMWLPNDIRHRVLALANEKQAALRLLRYSEEY